MLREEMSHLSNDLAMYMDSIPLYPIKENYTLK